MAVAVTVGLLAAGCSSVRPWLSPVQTSNVVPTSCMSDSSANTTGINEATKTITAGIIANQVFAAGSDIGVQAYFNFVNQSGGVNGWNLVLDRLPDGGGTGDASDDYSNTEAAIGNDFATVGSFSLFDSSGGTALAANPCAPDVSVTLNAKTEALPNVVSPIPIVSGWQTGPLEYFKDKYPEDITHTGTLVADLDSSQVQWQGPNGSGGEKGAMEKLGYNITFDQTFSLDTNQEEFDTYGNEMKSAGVKIVFLGYGNDVYDEEAMQGFTDAHFHPVVVLGAPDYTAGIFSSGGSGAPTPTSVATVGSAYLEQETAMYLSPADVGAIPAVKLFRTMTESAATSTPFDKAATWSPDLFTVYGWASAELFVDAVKAAGPNPTRGKVLRELQAVTSFNAGGLIATDDPSAKTAPTCWLLAQASHGQFEPVGSVDTSLTGPDGGFDCQSGYTTG